MDARNRRTVLVLGTGLFGLGVAVGGYGTYVSALIERGVSPDAAGFGMTIFLLGQLASVVPTDVLARRWSLRRVTAAGIAIGALGAAIGGVLDLSVVYGSRLLVGVGNGVAFLGAMTYAGLRAPADETAVVQGLLGGLFTLGLAVGLAATPTAVAVLGPHAPALAASAIAATGATATLTLTEVSARDRVALHDYVAPLGTANGMALGLANMATFGFLIVATTWYTDVLAGHPDLPASAVLVGFALATVGGRTGGGLLTRWAGERATVAVTLVVLGGMLGLTAVAVQLGGGWLLVAALVGTGAGFGLPFGPLFSLAFSSLAEDPGVTLVAMIVVGNAGALVFPWLVGRLLVDTGSFALGFGVMAATVFAVIGLWLGTVGLGREAAMPA